jgi:hypothetical protein
MDETDLDQLEQPQAAPAPGVPRSSSGAPLPPPAPSVQWTSAAQPAATGDLQGQISRMPLDQATAAYSAALKFQAMRGYQSDLQAGKSPADALAKWAPLMFTAPKEATLGQAATMVRNVRPPAPVIRTANGQIFQVGPNGAVPLTPPVTRHDAANQLDVLDYRDKLKEMDTLRASLAEDPNAKDKPMKLRRMRALQTELDQIRTRAPQVAAPAPTQIPPPSGAPTKGHWERLNDGTSRFVPEPQAAPTRTSSSSTKRVWVKAKDGRTGTIPEEQLDEALKAGYTRLNR